MHFTVLYVKEDTKLEDITLSDIEEEFGDAYCYCCGDREADIMNVCDWFQVGGRWSDVIKATRGIKGDPSWCSTPTTENDLFSIVEIADVDEEFLTTRLENFVYAVATPETYEENYDENKEFKEIFNKVKNKQINGVIALIDCHD